MIRLGRFFVACIWLSLIYILFRLNLLSGDVSVLSKFFDSCGEYKPLLFILISSLRVIVLLPSAVFMLLGGILFNPLEAFLLTLISVVLSESLIYIFSRVVMNSTLKVYLIKKYPKLYKMLHKNNSKILSISILCPVAPSDAACFLAGTTDMRSVRFVLTIVLSNVPMMLLYSFLGRSVVTSTVNTIIITAVILLVSGFSIHLWNKERKSQLYKLSRSV